MWPASSFTAELLLLFEAVWKRDSLRPVDPDSSGVYLVLSFCAARGQKYCEWACKARGDGKLFAFEQ